MTWGRAGIAVLVVWLIVLALLLQPHSHTPPRIEHARRLDVSPAPLPTLAP